MPWRTFRVGLVYLPLFCCIPACMTGSNEIWPAIGPNRVSYPEVQPQPDSQFAELITVPGERIPLQTPVEPMEPNPTTAEPTPVAVAPVIPVAPTLPEYPPAPPEELPPFAHTPPNDPALVALVRAALDGRTDSMQEALQQLPTGSSEVLQELIPVIVRASQQSSKQESVSDATELSQRLERAFGIYAKRSSLILKKSVLCVSVDGYGVYEKLPENQPLRPGEIYVLYVEVDNIPLEPATQNGVEGYMTRLVCSLQVRDESDRIIEFVDDTRQQPSPTLRRTKTDFSRSIVRDYFVKFHFSTPLKSGRYTLICQLRDPASGRVVSRTMPLYVQ